MPTALDLTGQKFGALTAVSKAPSRSGKTYWLCRCECGNEKEVQTGHLTSGAIQSCGCKQHLKKNSGKNVVNKLYDKAIGTAENSIRHKVGSITAQALKHTGKSGQIIHSLPSEIGEEIFTQLIPNNLDNYDEQIAQLADPNFYKDIALQTLIMGGGFGAIGVAGNLKHHKKMLFNKEYAEAYKEHQNVIEATKAGYKALNKNLNNDKFAELLTQASSKGIYNLEDRMKNIISLEAEGKTKQALHIAEAGITNMMHQAVVTGTQSEFVDSLRNIVNNKESEFIPESLKQAAKNVFERKGKKGIGLVVEDKVETGYSSWAKDKDIKKIK